MSRARIETWIHLCEDADIVNNLEATPQAKPPSKRRKRNASYSLSLRQRSIPEDAQPLDASSVTGSTRIEITSGSKSRRTRSPFSISDLRFADKDVRITTLWRPDQLPSDVAQLFNDAYNIQNARGIVPRSIEADVQSALTLSKDQLSNASFYDSQQWAQSQGLDSWDTSEELRILKKIVNRTEECDLENVSEAAWNARVHEPLLDFVFECFAGLVQHWDVTGALISKPYLPHHRIGADTQSKTVDFCLALAGDDIIAASQRRLKHVPDFNYINHTSYQPVRDRPIAVSIVTKTPKGSHQEAKAQLSTWATGHLKRLRPLAGTSQTSLIVDITLPVISLRGGDWFMSFVRDKADCVDLIETFTIGSTRSLVGCYKVVAFLRHLGIWIKTVYREWLMKNALAAGMDE